MATKLYKDNDNVLELDKFKDALADAATFLNAGTVTARILTTGGAEVVAPQTLAFVAASNGKYRVSLDKAVVASLTLGNSYDVEFTGAESGLDYRSCVRVEFTKRTG